MREVGQLTLTRCAQEKKQPMKIHNVRPLSNEGTRPRLPIVTMYYIHSHVIYNKVKNTGLVGKQQQDKTFYKAASDRNIFHKEFQLSTHFFTFLN